MKKQFKVINFLILAFSFCLNIGCHVYKMHPLAYTGEQNYQHKAKITRNKIKFTNTNNGKDTIYIGTIKTNDTGNIWSEFKYKAIVKTTEKDKFFLGEGRFYLIEFTKKNSKVYGGIEYGDMIYDVNKNQLILSAFIQMDTKFFNKGFTKELLSEIFFVWLNKDYYNKNFNGHWH